MNKYKLNKSNYSLSKDILLVINLSIFSILFFLYWTIDNRTYSYLGLLVIIISLLIFNKFEDYINIYFFLLSDISLFLLRDGKIALLSIILIIIFLKSLFGQPAKFDYSFLIVLSIYTLISVLSYSLGNPKIKYLFSEIRILVDIVLISLLLKKYGKSWKINVSRNINFFLFGQVLTIILGLVNSIFFLKDYNFRLQNLNGDPNYFSMCVAFSISIILLRIYYKHFNSIDLILLLFFLISGLLSQSRGFLVCMIPNFFFMIILIIPTIKSKPFAFFFIAFGILLLSTTSFIDINSILKNYLNRFGNKEYAGGSGRIEIWIFALKGFINDPKTFLIGTGQPILILQNTLKAHHNLYIELLNVKGVFGFIIFFLLLGTVYFGMKKTTNTKKIRYISLLPALTTAIGFLFLSGMLSDICIMLFSLSFAVSIYVSNQYFSKK